MPHYPSELQSVLDALPLDDEYRVPSGHEDVPYFAEGLQVRAVAGDGLLVTEGAAFVDEGGSDHHDLSCRCHTFTRVRGGPQRTACCLDCRAVRFPAGSLDGVSA